MVCFRPMSNKDVGLRIRVEKELREAFQEACVAENRNASEVLRDFMHMFAEQNLGSKQLGLFAVTPEKKLRRSSTRNSK